MSFTAEFITADTLFAAATNFRRSDIIAELIKQLNFPARTAQDQFKICKSLLTAKNKFGESLLILGASKNIPMIGHILQRALVLEDISCEERFTLLDEVLNSTQTQNQYTALHYDIRTGFKKSLELLSTLANMEEIAPKRRLQSFERIAYATTAQGDTLVDFAKKFRPDIYLQLQRIHHNLNHSVKTMRPSTTNTFFQSTVKAAVPINNLILPPKEHKS